MDVLMLKPTRQEHDAQKNVSQSGGSSSDRYERGGWIRRDADYGNLLYRLLGMAELPKVARDNPR